jgi:hypothetical protein
MSGHPIPDDAPGNYGHNRHRLACEPDPRAEEWRDVAYMDADAPCVPYSERVRQREAAQ